VKLFAENVAILAPGLSGWDASRDILAGVQLHRAEMFKMPAVDLLPAVERRRTNLLVKLALAVGHAALAGANRQLDSTPSVFASSGADGEVIHDICETLAGSDRQVSPTRFHNSVHNAPSGYWSIATHSHQPSISLCGFEWSFATGLLESAAQLASGRPEVLLIACDIPYPEPLNSVRFVTQPFGAALLFTRERTDHSMAELEMDVPSQAMETTRMQDLLLEQMRKANPCARALPLLAAIAGAKTQAVVLEREFGRSLKISVRPCQAPNHRKPSAT
jgi:hypothetical protein